MGVSESDAALYFNIRTESPVKLSLITKKCILFEGPQIDAVFQHQGKVQQSNFQSIYTLFVWSQCIINFSFQFRSQFIDDFHEINVCHINITFLEQLRYRCHRALQLCDPKSQT